MTPSTGELDVGAEKKLTVTAPKDTGRYTLEVTFTYYLNGEKKTITNKDTINVVDKIKLNAVVTNNGDAAVTLSLDFFVDGGSDKVNEDPVEVFVAAHSSATATFLYVAAGLSDGKHTFHVALSSEQTGADLLDVNLGGNHAFYVGEKSYTLMEGLLVVFLIILILVAIYIYRKPVRNYGKPKSRR